jgi:hypothetical protein
MPSFFLQKVVWIFYYRGLAKKLIADFKVKIGRGHQLPSTGAMASVSRSSTNWYAHESRNFLAKNLTLFYFYFTEDQLFPTRTSLTVWDEGWKLSQATFLLNWVYPLSCSLWPLTRSSWLFKLSFVPSDFNCTLALDPWGIWRRGFSDP